MTTKAFDFEAIKAAAIEAMKTDALQILKTEVTGPAGEQLASLTSEAVTQLSVHAERMAKDSLEAATSGRMDLVTEIGNQARLMLEVERLRLTAQGQKLLKNVMSAGSKMAVTLMKTIAEAVV